MLTLIVFFLLIALAGAALAVRELRGHHVPLAVGVWHGIAAVVAIVLLVIHDMHASQNLLINSATVVLILAATGGLLLFMFRAMRQALPGFVVILHAGFALAAILLLCAGYLKG